MELDQLRTLVEDQLRLSRRLKARIAELEADRHAPLAVVGMALRFPGGLRTPEAYWEFLLGNGHAVSEIPDDRPGLRAVHDPRPDQPGRSYVGRAGFLPDVADFDAGFFGISQREADALDPQQRLLLETAWEAMERAGIAVRRSQRLPAGVFVGIMAAEYTQRLAGGDRSGIDPYYGTGGGHCFAAGRVSYVMGLSGPALSVDTACSSSLVALHLGAQSLRREECRYALVGGSNLIFSPDLMVSLCQSGALAPDGRSKPFTAAADGYGRGEGAGMLVLMRLADARREGRPVLAVLRGTAVNHDGASSGLTVPSGPAQQEVIRAALVDAGVAPEELGFVEAHGTGTALGDPIEAGALDSLAGSGAPGRSVPLAIGSVKARLGHLEAAAGIAGLIKVVLMLRHGVIPASLSEADGPLNTLIPWDRVGLAVPRQPQQWPADLPRRLAGISAFGLSGTNAHAVLEADQEADDPAGSGASETAGAAGGGPRRELLTVSAKDDVSLRAQAVAVVAHLRELDPAGLASVCHTWRAGRAPFARRLAVTGSTPTELADRLARALDANANASADTAAGAVARVGTGGVVAQVQATVSAGRLRVGGDPDRLTAAVTALIDLLPALGSPPELGTGPAQSRLAGLLLRFGARVSASVDPALAPGGAELEWGAASYPLLGNDAGASLSLLLDALAGLFTAGVDLRLDDLAAPRARFVGDLPTYPFRHRRYWIDEPAIDEPAIDEGAVVPAGTPTTMVTVSAPVPVTASGLGAFGASVGPTAAPVVLVVPTQDGPVEPDVEEFLLGELADVLRAEDNLDPAQTFLDVGGDSFTAMLFTKNIEQHYQVTVPFDEFAVDLPLASLVGRLAAYIAAARSAQPERERTA